MNNYKKRILTYNIKRCLERTIFEYFPYCSVNVVINTHNTEIGSEDQSVFDIFIDMYYTCYGKKQKLSFEKFGVIDDGFLKESIIDIGLELLTSINLLTEKKKKYLA